MGPGLGDSAAPHTFSGAGPPSGRWPRWPCIRARCTRLACETGPDAITIASGDFNGDIQINRLTSNVLMDQQRRDVTRVPGTIWAVTAGTTSFGEFYACAGVSRSIYVVDPLTQEKRFTLTGHDTMPLSVS